MKVKKCLAADKEHRRNDQLEDGGRWRGDGSGDDR